MLKKIGSVAASITMLGVLGFVIWHQFNASTERKAKASRRSHRSTQSLLVEAATVKSGPIRETLSLTGTVEPKAQSVVFSMVPGVVRRMKIKEGQYVKKGEVLAQLDGYKMVLAAEQARAARALATVNVAQMTATYKRMKALYEAKALPKAKFEQVEAGYRAAKVQLRQAKTGVATAGAYLSDAFIRAPISGVVLKKMVNQGDLTSSAGMMKTSPLLMIADVDTVKIKVSVAEKDLARVLIGQRATLRVDAYPARVFSGKVTEIGEMVDPMTRTIPVTVEVPNSEVKLQASKNAAKKRRLLKVGMFARVVIVVAEEPNAVVIDIDTVLGKAGRHYVFVVKAGQAQRRQVVLGLKEALKVQVRKGLSVGDRLIVLGHRLVRNGQPVRIGSMPEAVRSGDEPKATPVEKAGP